MGALCDSGERSDLPAQNQLDSQAIGAPSEAPADRRDLSKVAQESADCISHVRAELDKVWVALDQDRDGNVTKKELKEALNRTGLHQDKRLKQYFAKVGGKMGGNRAVFAAMDALDQNGDGKISKAEFFATFYLETKLVQAFRSSDADVNGTLSKEEFNKMIDNFPELEVLMSRRGVKPYYVFEQIDTDQDGRVTVVEFMKKLHGNQLVVNLFDAIDTNRDGVIDKKELAKALNDAEQPELMGYLKSVGLKPVLVFEQLDLDGDGTVTMLEFMERLKNLKK
jgi:Ca2+-binding EF-hand superfamily protein